MLLARGLNRKGAEQAFNTITIIVILLALLLLVLWKSGATIQLFGKTTEGEQSGVAQKLCTRVPLGASCQKSGSCLPGGKVEGGPWIDCTASQDCCYVKDVLCSQRAKPAQCGPKDSCPSGTIALTHPGGKEWADCGGGECCVPLEVSPETVTA